MNNADTKQANRLTARATAYDSFAELVAACQTGWAPTLQIKRDEVLILNLQTRGLKVFVTG